MLPCSGLDVSDKCCSLAIGKSAKQQCLKGGKSLPIKYLTNKKSLDNMGHFQRMDHTFERDMNSQNYIVCLLTDNCTVHNFEDIKLENKDLKFFPPDYIGLIHPLDQGVINNTKSTWRQALIYGCFKGVLEA